MEGQKGQRGPDARNAETADSIYGAATIGRWTNWPVRLPGRDGSREGSEADRRAIGR